MQGERQCVLRAACGVHLQSLFHTFACAAAMPCHHSSDSLPLSSWCIAITYMYNKPLTRSALR